MKIMQISNIVSHHQYPLASALCELVGVENFRFAAMHSDDKLRSENGWKSDYGDSWILRPLESTADSVEFESFWDDADVILCGERLIEKMQNRVANKKLCFYMSERWWKPPIGICRLLQPSFLKMALRFRRLSKSEYFHYLPTGPFAAKDISKFTSMIERTWSWGYFPSMVHDDSCSSRQLEASLPIKVLWAGRMIDCKRVDILIKAVSKVNLGRRWINLTLIGDGPERKKLEKLASSILDRDSYSFNEFVPSTEMPNIMLSHDIYVFPSNSYEGWGAVVNEAMGAGCVVIASNQTGAGKAMIEHGVNGLLFQSGSVTDLANCLSMLIADTKIRYRMSEQASLDITTCWSPPVVAQRFVEVCNGLINEGKSNGFKAGPLSKI